MKKILIFGTTEIGELMYFYFTKSKEYDIIGFCVDAKYRDKDFFCGLPVFDYEYVKVTYTSAEYMIFVAMAYNNLMKNRDLIYNKIKGDGYNCPSFICNEATVYSESIGENTLVFENVTIQPGCIIGNNVLLSPGVLVAHHTVIEDNVYIGPNVSICGHNHLGKSLFIGANCVIAPNISVSGNSFIGAGCKIFKNTERNSVFLESGTRVITGNSESLKNILY